MTAPESDRFKQDYHKFADRQVNDRAEGDAMGRLRLAVFVGALGPGAAIVLHTIKYEPSSFIRTAMILTIPVALLLLIVNFIRLPGKTKSTPAALTIVLITLACAGATFPLVKTFFPAGP